MKILRDLLVIARKDLLEFSRDRMRLFTFFLMPMFMMIMVGFIFPNQNMLREARIGVVNADRGELGEQFINMLKDLKTEEGDAPLFVLTSYPSLDELKDAIVRQEVNGGIYLPPELSESIKENKAVSLTIVEDESNPQLSQLFNQVLRELVRRFSQSIALEKLAVITGEKPSLLRQLLDPVRAHFTGIVEGEYNYFEFVAPGIIAMIVLTAVLTGLAGAVAREREIGTLDGLLIAPVDRLAIVLGKALAQAVRGLIQGSIVLVMAMVLFGVKVNGSIALVFFLLLLGVFSFVGFGILVSAAATEQETATQMLFMFQFPMLFLSGVFFPLSLMPAFMQKISRLIPLTYAIEALRKVIILGAGFGAVTEEVIIMLAFGFITTLIAVPVFKRMVTR